MEGIRLTLLLLWTTLSYGDTSTGSSSGGGGSDGTEAALQVPVRGHGEPCTCDGDCDFNKWLTCHNGTCLCLSRTFLYDYSRQICVVGLGQKCFEIAQDYSQYKELPPFIRCVEGAFCSISAGGLCACNTYGFYDSADGLRCERKKDYATSCKKSLECKSDVCSSAQGKCVCREGEYYDGSKDRCLGMIGSYCFTDEDCTDYAICNGDGAKCTCINGYSETNTKRCAKSLSYGDECNSTISCNNLQFGCFNGVCLCRYPDHQLYDNVTGNCKTFPSSAPCFGNNNCVENAKCQDGFECQCLPGFVEMADGSCHQFSNFGVTCEKDEECDPVTPLVCKDFMCQCKDSLTLYDAKRRVCRGLVGYRKCQNNNNLCVQNAECVQLNAGLSPKCSCRPGHVHTPSRTCIKKVSPGDNNE